jgi:hypothetical protein
MRATKRSTRLTALAGALRETASALVQLETACRGIVSLSERDVRLQDFAGAERLFKRVRSTIRHVARELRDEAGAAVQSEQVRPRPVKH